MVKAPALPPQFPPGHRKPDGFANTTIKYHPNANNPCACPVRRAHHSCPLAVPPRRPPVACAPLVSRSPGAPLVAPRRVRLGGRARCPIAPPRHRRGARLGIPRPLLRALANAPWYGAEALPRMGMTKRRALRGYRGRTETPPAKLSACATCHLRCPCPVVVPRGAVPLR